LKIILPFHPYSLNKLLGANRWTNSQRKKDMALMMLPYLRRHKNAMLENVTIKIVLNFENKQRRDYDNFIGGMKYILDPLVDAKILKDDSCIEIKKFEFEMNIGTGKTETIINILEAKK